jgi:hypothetical protein
VRNAHKGGIEETETKQPIKIGQKFSLLERVFSAWIETSPQVLILA